MRKLIESIFVIVFAEAFLTGCVSTVDIAPKGGGDYKQEVLSYKPGPNEGAVVLFYKRYNKDECGFLGGYCVEPTEFYINGDEVTVLEYGDAAFVRVVPGKHRLIVKSPMQRIGSSPKKAQPGIREFTVKGGEVIYLAGLYERVAGLVTAPLVERTHVKQLSESEGRRLLRKSVIRLSRQYKIQNTMFE